MTSVESLFLLSDRGGPRLRIGLLFTPGPLPPPAASILGQLLACKFLHVTAAIAAPSRLVAATPTGSVLYRLYRWLDKLLSRQIAKSLVPHSCASELRNLALYAVDSDPSGMRLQLPEFQQEILKSCQLDVILAFGPVIDPQILATVARFGVWISKLGDPLLGDQQSRVFWHTIRQMPPVSISLEAFVEGRADPVTLAIGALSLATHISTTRNLSGPAHLGELLVTTKLWQLHASGWDYVLTRCPQPAVSVCPKYDLPTNSQMLAWAATRSLRQIRHRIRQLNTQAVWRVALRHGSQHVGLSAAASSTGFSWIDAPAGRYYADPFLVTRDGRRYLFVENFDLSANIGLISCLEVGTDGTLGPERTALERPYHLSYPQVIEHGGELYLLPESGFNNTVELYRAVEFPVRWELVRVLFRGPAFDTTVLQHDGRFWFFVTLVDIRYPHGISLLLFYSDTLVGNWTLHPASPISNDIRVARCAGSPFLDNGTWIRPAQDSSETYGGALRFQRIVRIDTQHYIEEPAGSLTSQMIPGSSGVHTYNRDGQTEAIDCKDRVILSEYLRHLPRKSA